MKAWSARLRGRWGLIIFAAIFVAEVGLAWRGYRAATQALIELRAKKNEREQFVLHRPSLGEENNQALLVQQHNVAASLEAMRTALRGRATAALAPPPTAIGLFFDLADFIKKSRELAERAHVATRSEENFGFSDYAHEGPAVELAAAVFRQRRLAAQVLPLLYAARPLALLSLQRERPRPEALRSPLPPPQFASANRVAPSLARGGAGDDFFVLPAAWSLRVPGQIESTALRVEFTGQTRALRVFLQSLADFDLPLIVRSVEVEALINPTQTVGLSAPTAPAGLAILVPPVFSKFSVIIEAIDLLPRSAPPAA